MRILEWAFPYLPIQGGRENFVHDIASELSRNGNSIMVFAQTESVDDPPYVFDDSSRSFPVHRFNLTSLTGPNSAEALQVISSAMQEIACTFAPDVIHFHTVGQDTLLLKAVKSATGAKIVQTLHNKVVRNTSGYVALLALPHEISDAVVAVSRFVFEDYLRLFPQMVDRTHLILNGVETRSEPSQAIKPAPGDLQVFASGRLSPEKGFPILLSAWSTLLPRIGGGRLKIAGDGPARIALERYIRHLGIENSVELLGWTSRADIATHLQESHFVVVPSIWEEPFGLVAAEALMAGRSVIASSSGGLTEIVRPRENGMLFQPGDIFELSATLYFMATHPTAMTEFGRQGHLDALKYFSLAGCVAQYQALFSKVVGA